MSAMACSFILSRTLVPTLANYLLRPHAPHIDMHGLDGPLPPASNPLVRLQRGFERGFERLRLLYRELLIMALARRAVFVIGFLAFVFGSFALTPYLGRDFFPTVDAGQILMHARTHVGTRVEETAQQFAEIEKAIRRLIPPEDLGTVVDNVGLPGSGINMTYNTSGTFGAQDGDIQIKLNEDHRPTADYVRMLREQLPLRFPGVTFSFLPADIISQILNFGAPAPIDLQIRGPSLPDDFAYAEKLLRVGSPRSGPGRRPHPAGAQLSRLQCRCRSHPRAICRPHGTRRDQQPRRQSGRQQPGRPDLLAKSGQRRELPDRHADAAISSRTRSTRCKICPLRRPARLRKHSAPSPQSNAPQRRRSIPSTTSCQWCRSTAPRRAAISAPSRPTFAVSWRQTPKRRRRACKPSCSARS